MNILEAFDIVKITVSEIRKLKTDYKLNEIYIGLDSKHIEVLIHYHSIIEKLTKVNVHFYGK
jgi:hypothetical protein